MNILIIHPCKGFYGGAEEVVVQLYRYLVDVGHTVALVTKDAPVEMAELLKLGKVDTPLTWRDFVADSKRQIRRADTILCFNFPAPLVPLLEHPRKSVVWYCNEPPELFTTPWRKPLEALNRWWVRTSKMRCVVATKRDAERFQSIYHTPFPVVVPYGVDYDFWSVKPPNVKRSERLVLLQVGHSELFGTGEAVYREVCKTVPNADLVQLSGESLEAVRAKYNWCSILVHLVTSHGGWLAPFEAMCAGLPVVATSDFAAADLVRRAGMLNSANSVEETAKAVLFIWERYSEYVESQRAKDFVRENLTWERFGQAMLSILKEAAECRIPSTT